MTLCPTTFCSVAILSREYGASNNLPPGSIIQSPLIGKLFDETGEPLYVQGAAKGQRRYRYYVSKSLVKGDSDGKKGWRLSAPEIEQAVFRAAVEVLSDRPAITLAFEEARLDSDDPPSVLESSQSWSERLQSADESASALAELIERVEVSRTGIRVLLGLPTTSSEAGENRNTGLISLVKILPMQMRRRGVELRVVLPGNNTAARFDRPLIKAIARAHRWSQQLLSGEVP